RQRNNRRAGIPSYVYIKQMTSTAEHTEILNNLKREIILNPKMRNRIILRAIKTSQSKELQKVIRKFFKQNPK
ncbi:MAG: hypothetical protein AAGA02_03470, partial [Bacteroidota bacterium]